MKRRGQKGKLWLALRRRDHSSTRPQREGEKWLFELSIIEICMRAERRHTIRPRSDVIMDTHNYVSSAERERQLRLSILFARDRRFVVLEEKVLFLCECVFECATQTLAVRDTQVQSTGRSLRMRTWVWAGALCMHGWAQIMCKARQAVCRTSPSLSHRTGSIKANTCSGRVWLALHLATPKSCLLSFSHYRTWASRIHASLSSGSSFFLFLSC